MVIPLYIFLVLYLLFVVVWLVFSLVALYHIIKYGQINFMTFSVTFIYLAAAAVILYWSYVYINQIDWSAGFTLLYAGNDWFGPGQ